MAWVLLSDNDNRILAGAVNLAAAGDDVTLVSRSRRCGSKASAVGLVAAEYRAELAVDSGWAGIAELQVSAGDVATLKGHSLFAHATLTHSERSSIAPLVTQLLEGSGG